MIILKEPIVYVDVDDTIVSWDAYGTLKEGMVEFEDPISGHSMWLEVIQPTIDSIKAHKVRGHTVVVLVGPPGLTL